MFNCSYERDAEHCDYPYILKYFEGSGYIFFMCRVWCFGYRQIFQIALISAKFTAD